MGPTAYLDEAFSAGPTGVYVVAVVVVPSGRADGLRADLRELIPRGARRFHWHHEQDAVRQRMLEFIASAGLAALSVTACLHDPRAQDRARALGLERVLWELRSCHVHHLMLESRQERNNQRDRRQIGAAQRTGRASSFTYDFGSPTAEPLLWMADAVASAVLAAESGRNSAMVAIIAPALCRILL
jgi:hypothetical protein